MKFSKNNVKAQSNQMVERHTIFAIRKIGEEVEATEDVTEPVVETEEVEATEDVTEPVVETEEVEATEDVTEPVVETEEVEATEDVTEPVADTEEAEATDEIAVLAYQAPTAEDNVVFSSVDNSVADDVEVQVIDNMDNTHRLDVVIPEGEIVDISESSFPISLSLKDFNYNGQLGEVLNNDGVAIANVVLQDIEGPESDTMLEMFANTPELLQKGDVITYLDKKIAEPSYQLLNIYLLPTINNTLGQRVVNIDLGDTLSSSDFTKSITYPESIDQSVIDNLVTEADIQAIYDNYMNTNPMGRLSHYASGGHIATSDIRLDLPGFEEPIPVLPIVETITETEMVPFDVVERENVMLSEDIRNVVEQGIDGQIKRVYEVTRDGETGEELARVLISETVTLPQNQIVEVGTGVSDTQVIVETEAIPFEIEYIEDETLLVGTQRIEREGVLGTRRITTTQDIFNGEPVGEPRVEVVVDEPVSQIVYIGTMIGNEEPEVPVEEEPTDEPEVPVEEEPTDEPEIPVEEEPTDEPEIPVEEEPTDEPEIPVEEEPTDEPEVPVEEEPTDEPEVPVEEEPTDEPEVPVEEEPTDEPEVPVEEEPTDEFVKSENTEISVSITHVDEDVKSDNNAVIVTPSVKALDKSDDNVTVSSDGLLSVTKETAELPETGSVSGVVPYLVSTLSTIGGLVILKRKR